MLLFDCVEADTIKVDPALKKYYHRSFILFDFYGQLMDHFNIMVAQQPASMLTPYLKSTKPRNRGIVLFKLPKGRPGKGSPSSIDFLHRYFLCPFLPCHRLSIHHFNNGAGS